MSHITASAWKGMSIVYSGGSGFLLASSPEKAVETPEDPCLWQLEEPANSLITEGQREGSQEKEALSEVQLQKSFPGAVPASANLWLSTLP